MRTRPEHVVMGLAIAFGALIPLWYALWPVLEWLPKAAGWV